MEPLIEAHRATRAVRLVLHGGPVSPAELRGAEALVVVGPRERSPRTALPGLTVADAAGRPVPAGWVPDLGRESLSRFATAASCVLKRARAALPRGPVALLGQWDERTLRMASRTEGLLRRPLEPGEESLPVFRWTAERIVRRDLLGALRLGLGMALYVGHGRPAGWAAYHGLHVRHLPHARGEPTGAMLSMTCDTASRHLTRLSFAEALVMEGVTAAALGAVRRTLHLDNGHLVMALCGALREGRARTLAELLRLAGLLRPRDRTSARQQRLYRITGDPLAPLLGAAGAAEAAARVFAPAPDDPLPPPDDEAPRMS